MHSYESVLWKEENRTNKPQLELLYSHSENSEMMQFWTSPVKEIKEKNTIKTWTCKTLQIKSTSNQPQPSWTKETLTPIYLILIDYWSIARIWRRRSVRRQWTSRSHALFWNHLVVLQCLFIGVLSINKRH